MKRIEHALLIGLAGLLMTGSAFAQDTTLTVTSEGNVGIGTTVPTHKLVVDGSLRLPETNRVMWGGPFSQEYIYNPNGQSMRIHVGNDDRIHIANAGNVGIGTTSPFSRLHVHSDGVSRIDLSTASTEEPVFHRFFHSANIQGAAIGFDTDDNVVKLVYGGNFSTSTRGLVVSQDGNLGLGTSPSGERVEIAGNVQFSPGGNRFIKFLDPLLSLFVGANPAGEERGPHAIHLVTDDGTGSTVRLSIVGDNGFVGIGKPSPTQPLEMGSGAHVTSGGVWVDASSRAFKENIASLPLGKALDALTALDPVTFNYKTERGEAYLGFIAEEVPDLVANGNRKSLSPMDIVAVLTKVVQHQQRQIDELEARLDGAR